MILPFELPVTTTEIPSNPVAVHQQQVMQVDNKLRVEYTTLDVDAVTKTLIFTGDVVAKYGLTEVRTKQLT